MIPSFLRPGLCWALLAVATAAGANDRPRAREKDPLRGLDYRLVGPFIGGRVSRAAGVPGDPRTYYAATASGGVWKSTTAATSGSPSSTISPTRVDRLHRRGAVRPERRLRRLRRGQHPRQRRRRQRHLQVRRRAARPGHTSGSRKARSARMVVHPTQPRRRLRGRARPRVRAQPRARRLSHDATAARPGSRSSRRTPTPARSTCALDPDEPERSSSPGCGRRGAGPGS